MQRTHVWTGLAAATVAVAAILALASIWLITSRPVAVVEAIDGGSVTPVVRAVSAVLVELWDALRQWL